MTPKAMRRYQTGLSGCFIRIFNADNECVYDSGKDECAPTDENGVIRITGLPHGDCSYIETVAPEGYAVSKKIYTFSIDALGHVTDTSDTVIVDNSTEVTLTKTDIVDSQRFSIFLITTDADGIANTSLLRYGNYTLRESKAPANYIAGDYVPFSVEADGSVIELVYYETPVVKTGSTETNHAPTIVFSVIGLILLTGTCCILCYPKKTRYTITKNTI